MTDIVERLRSFRSLSWFVHANDKYEISLRDANKIVACGLDAADEIDRLRAILAEAREAAEPFADEVVATWVDELGWTEAAPKNDRLSYWFGPSDFRAALALAEKLEKEKADE